MRKYFTQEEREAYNAQKNAEANQRIDELARRFVYIEAPLPD